MKIIIRLVIINNQKLVIIIKLNSLTNKLIIKDLRMNLMKLLYLMIYVIVIRVLVNQIESNRYYVIYN